MMTSVKNLTLEQARLLVANITTKYHETDGWMSKSLWIVVKDPVAMKELIGYNYPDPDEDFINPWMIDFMEDGTWNTVYNRDEHLTLEQMPELEYAQVELFFFNTEEEES